jgi:hypothetical protein
MTVLAKDSINLPTGRQGLGLGRKAKDPALKKNTNSKKLKPAGPIHGKIARNGQIWQNFLRNAMARRGLFCR